MSMITIRTKNIVACVLAAQQGKGMIAVKDLPDPTYWLDPCRDTDGVPSVSLTDGKTIHFSKEFIQLCKGE